MDKVDLTFRQTLDPKQIPLIDGTAQYTEQNGARLTIKTADPICKGFDRFYRLDCFDR
ncbi:hypothetical protein [Psychrosphaera sp. I2R16]|uniref:hypothetical protein n=1 Tax=Psychrosphaera sp. I2R16 TaxID=2841558 RepID=UPI001C08E041|nr:hypothetical protein [Psychrosphaera sp. I2R16]